MPIDLLTLVRTLTSVITSLQKQYDEYNKLQDNKQESLVTFCTRGSGGIYKTLAL